MVTRVKIIEKKNSTEISVFTQNVRCVGCFESEVKVPFKVLCLIY